MTITSNTSTLNYDREKFLAAQLVSRSTQRMVAASLCDKVKMPEGAGETAYFIRYKRMNVPVDPLSDDGADPSESSFSLEEFSVALDEWGDVITITSRAILNTKHPLMQEAMNLLADNAARVMDREIQLVWLAGTNTRFGDGSVATRAGITSSMKLDAATMMAARVQMVDDGAPPRGVKSKDVQQASSGMYTGGANYVAVAGPQVLADIGLPSANLGTWVAVATYGNAKAMSNFEVGIWMNIRWVETNFIPKFVLLGNETVAATGANAGGITGLTVSSPTDDAGTLKSGTAYYWKVVRKSLQRGFAEEISIAHTTTTAATGDTESVRFAFAATTEYVYDLYFDSVTDGGDGTDTNLKLVQENIPGGTTINVLTEPTTGANPPTSLKTSTGAPDVVHPIYIHAAESCKWVGFYDARFHIAKDDSIIGNVLKRKRALGYNFFGKAMLCDQTRLLRLEVASTF